MAWAHDHMPYSNAACASITGVGAQRSSMKCILCAQHLAEHHTDLIDTVPCEPKQCKGTRNGIGAGETVPLP